MNKAVARIAIGSAIAVLFSTVSLAGALPKTVRDTYNRTTAAQYDDVCTKGSDHELYFEGPTRLWPPNHKYYPGLTAVTAYDATGDEIDMTSTGMHNQYDGDTEWNGSGHTADDMKLADGEDAAVQDDGTAPEVVAVDTENDTDNSITIAWSVRSERSGHKAEAVDGQGRVYTITGTATYEDGDEPQTCEHSWQIIVPHDMSIKNR